jgi:hypothetical protein
MFWFPVALTLSAALATAEPLDRGASGTLAPSFGTANTASYQITPFDFSPVDSSMHFIRWGLPGGLNLSTTSPYGAFFSSPELPSGALLTGMTVNYCNNNPPGGDDFLVILENVDTSGNFLGMLGSVTAHANDLCTSQSVDLTSQNFTFLNHVSRLLVWVIFGPNPPAPTDPIVAVSDVRLTYQLQIGRPPLTPTFSDVPQTDSGFRYIEALAASGVTAGCGGGKYCPDNSITRRQMAAFLSRALGLAYRFGTVATTIQVPEWQFVPVEDTVLYADTGPPQLSRYVFAVDLPVFESAVGLPSGAVLDVIAFDFCDDRPAGSDPIDLTVWGDQGQVAQLDSIPGGGCGFVQTQEIGQTVGDNKLIAFLQFGTPYGDSQSRFQGARFTYHLQVSPPPATATFGDVPTSDPAFAFVEALAASGISSGCGGGNFCPASPVTRRQMAIFLAKALGLSFN